MRRSFASAMCAYGCWALFAVGGCGGDDDRGAGAPLVGPLPLGDSDPRAYTEEFLARNPDASLQPGHVAVVRLRPTGDDGLACEAGVRCVPYHFENETDLMLSIHASTQQLERLVVVDPFGTHALDIHRDAEPAVVHVQPGRHVIELHHFDKGNDAAAEETLFLRSEAGGGQTAQGRTTIEASRNCPGCNFYCSDLRTQNFDQTDLSGASFQNANLNNASFRGSAMSGCQLQTVFVISCGDEPDSGFTSLIGTDFTNANLFGARLDGSSGSAPNFTGTRLDETTWDPVVIGSDEDGTVMIFTDLPGAIFRGAAIAGVRFIGTTFDGADFRGVDLTAIHFSPPMNVDRPIDADQNPIGSHCDGCDFGPDPESGDTTVMEQATVLDTVLTNSTFTGVDLTEATFRPAALHGARFDGAVFAGADLTGAALAGASFVGAHLTGLLRTTFNNVDLTATDFSGVDFNGFDLSQTDLSRAILSSSTGFAGATLSDGVAHGVNLTGYQFARQTAQLRGLVLSYATLDRVGLEEADLEGATMKSTRLVGANLSFANLHGANLQGASLGVAPNSGMLRTALRGAFMTDVDLTDADLRSADLTDAHLYGDARTTLLIRTQLDSAVLDGAICSGAAFSGSLTDAVFNNAQLVNSTFNGADLTNAKFDKAYLQGTDFSSARSVAGVSINDAGVATEAGVWMFMERDGTPFTIQYAATNLGAMTADSSVICPDGGFGPCNTPDRLQPIMNGPFPPQPDCVPRPPRYDNCLPPSSSDP